MAEEQPLANLLREAQRTARRLTADGEEWLVYELPPTAFDRRTSPSLVFESDVAVRRIRQYPPGWRSLSDNELFALSWSV
jgi:hypothetical protein